jgi:hypothetical protein
MYKIWLFNRFILERRKMFVGKIENDQELQLKMGDMLSITNDDAIIGKHGVISVKNCTEFHHSLLE